MGVLTHRSYLENAYKALYSKRGVFPFSPLRPIRLLTDFLVGILLRSEFFLSKRLLHHEKMRITFKFYQVVTNLYPALSVKEKYVIKT